MAETFPTLPAAVATAAAALLEPVLARAALIGLPDDASQAVEFGCGIGCMTAALADHFGSAVGIDPSVDLIECARIMHAAHDNCTFVIGGTAVLRELPGRYDFAYVDLRKKRLADWRNARGFTSALMRTLAPGGVAAIRLAGTSRRPTEWRAVTHGMSAGGGKLAWVGAGDESSLWLYAVAAPGRSRRESAARTRLERAIGKPAIHD